MGIAKTEIRSLNYNSFDQICVSSLVSLNQKVNIFKNKITLFVIVIKYCQNIGLIQKSV